MIGIISDSHDNLGAIRKAVEFFNDNEVKAVLHAGDLVSPFTARVFEKLKSKLYVVFGNNDGDKVMLTKSFEDIGATVCGDFGELTVDSLHIALLHGTNEALVKALAKSEDFDVIIRGHTHDPGIKVIKGTLLINPGECCGWVTGKSTVGILELPSKKFELSDLGEKKC